MNKRTSSQKSTLAKNAAIVESTAKGQPQMSDLTKLFYHTGTTSPTDIGPATGGVLHSIIVDTSLSGAFSLTVRDGGSSGTIIFQGSPSPVNPVQWKGAKLDGQLNVTIDDSDARVTIEMSEVL